MNLFKPEQFDLIAIGDTVIDDFIKIEDAEIIPGEGGKKDKICLSFGDKIPYSNSVIVPAVGNSANAAVATARLGLKTALVSNIGDDRNGDLCLTSLKESNVNTKYVSKVKDTKTNYHYVLWYGDDRTILIKHEEYKYELPNIGEPKWLYLSSLGNNSLPFHNDLADYLDEHPEIKLAFQPGTYQIRFGAESLKRIYARTDLFFSNKEEAQKILNSESEDIRTLADGLKTLGPKTVFITDGKNGAYCLADSVFTSKPIFPDAKPAVERTGAGDAFSATATAAIFLGLDIETAMEWGLVNSMSVVQQIGAQKGLLNLSQIKEYLAKAL